MMNNSNRASKLLKKGLAYLGIVGTLAGVLSPAVVSAHEAFFLGVTINPDTKQYIGVVSGESIGNGTTKHAEVKNTDVWFGESSKGLTFKPNNAGVKRYLLPDVNPGTEVATISSSYSSFFNQTAPRGTYKETLPFTFPGRHGGKVDSKRRQGDGRDRDQAYWVNTNLVEGLNTAIGLVYDSAYSDDSNSKRRVVSIATKLANSGAIVAKRNGGGGGSTSFSINGKTFTVSGNSGISNKNRASYIAESNYIKLTLPNKQSVALPWSVSKGYGSKQRLEDVVKNSTYAKVVGQDADFLSWQHIVMQGTYNSFVKGIEYAGAEELNQPNMVEKLLAGLLSGVQNQIQSILGLYTLPEMMLNRGTYEIKNWRGIMPNKLAEVADYVHIFVQVIAWFLISGAFVKLLMLRNLAAINTRMRIDLKEGFMDLIVAGFALIMFIPIFKTTVILNDGLVQFFGGISANADAFGTANGGSSGMIGAILISFVFLFMTIYMNIIYIMRGITIAALYAFAPLFIVSIAYGGKYKQLFSNFTKELVSAIFMQSIHAGLLGLYATAFATGIGNTLYTMVLTASFIPVTKMFKSSILGMSDGPGEGIAGMGTSAIGGLAIAGVATAKGVSSSMGGGKSNGGSGTIGTNFKSNGGNGGGPNGGSSLQSMTQNDEKTGAGSPGHYSGDTKPLTSSASTAKGAGNGLMKEKAMQGLGAAGNVLKAGAALVATTGLGVTDVALGTDMKRTAMMNRKLNGGHGKNDSYAGSGGQQAKKAQPSNIPSKGYMDQYEAKEGEQGHQLSATHEDSSISSVYNKDMFQSETGVNDVFENDTQIVMNSTPELESLEYARLSEASQVFEKGSSDEIREYQEQGLDYVKPSQNGGFSYALNKKASGIISMEQNDSHVMFHRKSDADSLIPNFKDKDSIASKVGQMRYDDTPKSSAN